MGPGGSRRRGFSVAAKPDSYDICFIPDGDTRGYLTEKLGSRPGSVVDAETGEVLAAHEGTYGYTIGQRKGLNLGRPAADGRPRYVLDIEPVSGTVTVGSDAEAAITSEFTALQSEITRIKDNTTFNGDALFAGTAKTFQVGYASDDTIDVSGTALADFDAGTAMAAISIVLPDEVPPTSGACTTRVVPTASGSTWSQCGHSAVRRLRPASRVAPSLFSAISRSLVWWVGCIEAMIPAGASRGTSLGSAI